MADKKAKILKRYVGEVKIKKQQTNRAGLLMKDQEQIDLDSSFSEEEESQEDLRRARVPDSDEEEEVKPKVKVQDQTGKKSKAVSKGIRKALGLKKGEDIQQFVNSLKIQGVDMNVIEQYLKHNKEGLHFENKKEKKQKKKKQKVRENEGTELVKKQYEQKQDSEQSDFVIPEQSRTIYRDKEGRIKQFSKAQEKEMRVKEVMGRLGEWEKGMKDESVVQEQQQMIDVWDDPARRWQSTSSKHPLQCPFQGYANRFNIKPGYRWDGVIRGNGFENTYLQQINLKKAEESREHREYMKNL